MKYVAAIGLEIHAELLTKTKLFCSCENSFGGEANTRCCPVCTGFPGAVGELNKEAVELSVKAGLVTDCTVCLYSAFDRKNYFYPDLPKAYQITQQRYPICKDGKIEIDSKQIRIDNIHLEEDAGKLLHRDNMSYIDYNRCGVPLIEIVTKPDMAHAEEAVRFVQELALRLKYAHVCDGKMEEGSLRVDVNVSLAPYGSMAMGTRVEIKNLSSFKSVKKAIDYEISRQKEVLEQGKEVVCETRRFDENSGITISMRQKEAQTDYRYFPEPDITPVILETSEILEIKESLPEGPNTRYKRYTKDFGLAREEAQILVSGPEISDFYELVCQEFGCYKKSASLILVGLGRLFNEHGSGIDKLKFSHKDLGMLALMWHEEKISAQSAMEILEIMFLQGGSPMDIAEKNNLLTCFDYDHALQVVKNVIKDNPDAVADYRAGKSKAFGYLMGRSVAQLGKNTNPAKVKQILEKTLQTY